MNVRRAGVGVLLVAMITLTACSGAEPGTANPGGSGSSERTGTPSSSTRTPEVPEVGDPLEVSALKADPCTALSAAQVDKLNLQPGMNEFTETSGKSCEYEYANGTGNQVSVGIGEKLENGLADIYAKKGALGYFVQTTVAGYPAVYASPPPDARDEGECQLFVGLTDTVVLRLFVILYEGTSDYSRPCDVAKLTAKNVVHNLQGES